MATARSRQRSQVASQLAEAHNNLQVRLRDLVSEAVLRMWNAMPYHGGEDAPRAFVDAAVPVVMAGQRQAIALVDGFLAQAMDRPAYGVNPQGIIGGAVRGGVPMDEVYRRPFVTLWSLFKQGKLWPEANKEATARLVTTVRTDLLLSANAAGSYIAMRDPEIDGLGRVLHGTCDLCESIAGEVTPSQGLQPIHPGCECGFDPVRSMSGRTSTTSPRAGGAVARVEQHGELGPLLVYQEQEHMSEAEAQRRTGVNGSNN